MSKRRTPRPRVATAIATESHLASGWATSEIGNVCDVNPRKPTRLELPDSVPVSFVPMPAVDAEIAAITSPQVRVAGEVRKGFTAFQDGDVIVAKITPSMENGKAAVARGLTNGYGYGSTEFHVLRPKEGVLSEYILHFIRQRSFRADAAMHMTGTAGQKRVPADFLRAATIPVPPSSEQTRIVVKLGSITRRIQATRERLQAVPHILERLALSSLAAGCAGELTEEWRDANRSSAATPDLLVRIQSQRHASLAKKRRRVHPRFLDPSLPSVEDLPDLPDLPPTWVWTSVGFVASRIQYGSSARSAAASDGVPNLGMQNIQDGRIQLKGLKYVERDSDEIPELLLQRGDVLFNRTNSPELVGKSAVFKGGLRAIFASYLVRVQVQADLAVPEFVCHWINSPWGRSWAEQVKSDGVSQSNINSTKLAEMPLPLPPVEEQGAICAKLDQLLALTEKIGERASRGLQQAEWLAQSCFAQAFAGTLVETEASIASREERSFESGGQLLERIKSVPVSRPTSQRVPYEVADMPTTRTSVMKALADIDRDSHLGAILRKGRKGMTPEQLLKASDLSVDDFYTQLKREVEAKNVKETRKNKATVLLEVMR